MSSGLIYKNFLFAKTVGRILEHSPLNRDTLGLTQFLASWLMSNYSTIYFSKILEKKISSLNHKFIVNSKISSPKNKILIVTTNLVAHGGHSRVIENIISNFPPNYFDIYLTSQTLEIPKKTTEIASNNNCKIINSPKYDYISRAQDLNTIAINYRSILLTTNADDITPLLPFSHNLWSVPIYFYNLADHLFGLNVTIANKYLDMSKFGAEISKEMRDVVNSEIVPIPLDLQSNLNSNYRDILRTKHNIPLNATVLLSGGASFKYLSKNDINFIEIALNILDRTSNSFIIVIGPSPKEETWAEAIRKNPRLVVINEINYDEFRKYYDIADYYIDSLPISGFTTLLEASSRGLKVIFADQGEAYPDSIATYAISLNNYIDEVVSIIKGKVSLEIPDISEHLPNKYIENLSRIFKYSELKKENGRKNRDVYNLDSYTKALYKNSTPLKGHNQLSKVIELSLIQRYRVVINMVKILGDYRPLIILLLPKFIYKLFRS